MHKGKLLELVNFNLCWVQTVAALTQKARIKPTGPVLTLLGKGQMKASLLHEAIHTFNKALEVMVSFLQFSSTEP